MIRRAHHLALALATLAGAGSATASVIGLASDAAFGAFQADTGFTKAFGGNVRWGDGGPSGDWEYAIVDGDDLPVGAVGQADWLDDAANTHTVDFLFDGASFADLTLGSPVSDSLGRSVGAGDVNTLLVRAKDGSGDPTALSAIEIDVGLTGTFVALGDLIGDGDAEYLGLIDPELAGGFALRATATLNGDGDVRGSDPMYQFKVGTARVEVPEPASAALLLGGIAALVRPRRRR